MAKGKKQDVRRPRRAPELGGIYGFQMYEGTFGACQVLSIDGPRVELATLDVLQDRPVATTDLDGVKVARRLFHGEAPRPARCVVDADVPWWATHLVTRAPVEVFDDPCNAFGGGWMVAFDRYFQARRGRSDRPRWQHDPTDVDIDLGGGRRPVRRDIRRLSLGDGGDLPRAKGAPGHFDALEALPYLDELSYAGPGAGFAELVRRRAISRVTWRAHEQTEIDLSSPHLDEIVIEVTAPLHLVVSPSLLSLHVEGDPAWLTVSGASVAFPFELGLRSGLGVAPKGLEAVTRLHVSGVRDGDARALTTFTALRDLIVAGKPGKLRHPEALAALSELRTLWFLQLYDLDADAWPGADAFPHV